MEQINKLIQGWMWEELHNRIVVNTKDGSVMVFVPSGYFEMGDNQDHDTPKHPVYLAGYWIGIYCVTRSQYATFLKSTGYVPVKHKALCEPTTAKIYMDHPVVCVNWADADAYANWANCQLPTEAQWEKAARGPKGLIYPWGNNWDQNRCRCKRKHNRTSQNTCEVYAYPMGVSGYGTYNQSGNVWEWCADWYDADTYKNPAHKRNPSGPEQGIYRVIRGGSWDHAESGYFRNSYRYWHDPGYRRDSLGFRLIRSAPEASSSSS